MSKASIRSLLIDTNVWMAYFIEEEPDHQEVSAFVEETARLGVTLVYTPTTLKDVFYLIPRRLRRNYVAEYGEVEGVTFVPSAWACVEQMVEMAVAARQALPECHMAWALRGEHADLEDNLIFAAAETSGADYVVTYDRELLERLGPSCITPAQALVALRVGRAAVQG